ncbi:GNAT family N-acetyltransferase [Calothrix sp. HK-06]|nr:GNAT family N-acetyltransferase [Calothrix sp. HK-06]
MSHKVVSQLNESQICDLLDLYKNEFWSKKRIREDTVKMLAASDIVVGLVDENDKLIGFARVLTDFVYRAIIFDVIIKPTHRNTGLGKQLMHTIIEHPQLSNVEHFALWCLPEMAPYYAKWGFTSEIGVTLMFGQNISNRRRDVTCNVSTTQNFYE